MRENIISVLVLTPEKPEKVTQDELKEVLKYNDGDLERLQDFKGVKLVWGYLCRTGDYFRYALTDMDKVILIIDDNTDEPYGYEHTGNFYPTHKEGLRVIGLMDENAEIEPIQSI